MKCIKIKTKEETIVTRVTDLQAAKLVSTGAAKYASKAEWKTAGRFRGMPASQ